MSESQEPVGMDEHGIEQPVTHQNRDRFVLVCQQLLTLLVVVAIIAPAANLVTLDIVAPPAARPTAGQAAGPAADR